MGNEVHFEIDPAEYLHERVPGRVGRNAPGEVRGECVDVSDSNLNQIHIPLRLTPHISDRLAQQQQLDARQDSRKSKRFPIEVSKKVVIEFERSDGRVTADAVLRDMSEEGMGLWIGSFIHPNTHCWITVMSDHGPEFEIEGEVRWCRHFTHAVHEIGISMNRKNANILSETLSEQSNKLASDVADLTSMIRLVLQKVHPHLAEGLSPELTSEIYNELSSLIE